MENKVFQKPRCKKCGSGYGYVKVTGEFVCRVCGEITKEENKK